MRTTYLSLGSNIGDKEANIRKALYLIKKEFDILDLSSLYFTPPIGYVSQPYFLNMVIKIDSEGKEPLNLLSFLQSIEEEMGRERKIRWGPRIIDIDIVYIEGFSIDTDRLTVPHRELFNRNFVLIPLSEITDYIMVENKKITVRDLIIRDSDPVNRIKMYKSRSAIEINE
jgi:2-amino-4-hydroxy-6-hydroxymethyldihydropteridine diphosphokinase